jgi:DNA-directed RNA polymerase subunit RPC12/RpoP
MTHTVQITRLSDFQTFVVRCKGCGAAMVFPVAAQIRHVIECQGCGSQIEIKPALPLIAGIQQAQATEFKSFALEFETRGPGA